MAEKKGKKRKIRFKGLLVIILILYLFGSCIYYLYRMPVKNIEVKGNFYLKDNFIINYLDIEDESIIKISEKKIKNKLLELDLISDVKVKKNFLGKVIIEVLEDKILFYNWNNKKVILSSGSEIDYKNEYLGIPTLINYVDEEVYKELIDKLSDKIDRETLALVSEIEYDPTIVDDKVVASKRFLFRMNDGNKVYVDTINIEKFNDYLKLYEYIVNKNGDVKGCLYLDSDSENIHFNDCKSNPVVEDDLENGEN